MYVKRGLIMNLEEVLFMKKHISYLIVVLVTAIVFLFACCNISTPENPNKESTVEDSVLGKTYKVDLSKLTTWDKTDSFDKKTGKLTIAKQYNAASLSIKPFDASSFNYLEIKCKIAKGSFRTTVQYSDDSTQISKTCCENDYSAYIKLSDKKSNVDSITIQAFSDNLSTIIESIAFVEKIPAVQDKQTGTFNTSVSSMDLAKQMKVGWNLGFTLQSVRWWDNNYSLDSEISWGDPYTTKEMIEYPKSKGYSTIRIPVTWFNHIIDDQYTIDPDWMKRVKTVVDWAIDAGYYVILNEHESVHGESQTPMSNPIKYGEGYIVRNNPEDIAESERFLKAIWTQIATAFNGSYDEHLIFETMNEPRNSYHEHEWWPGQKLSWVDATNCEECLADYKILNDYNKVCLDAIRATSGNNAHRFVMIPALCTGEPPALNDYFKLPKDTISNKLILTVHNYLMGATEQEIENKFSSEIENKLKSLCSQLNEKFIKKGIPVIVGETGAFKTIPLTERIKWITFYSKLTSSYGMPLIYWDGGQTHAVEGMIEFDKINLKFYEPDFVQAMLDNWKCEDNNESDIIFNGIVDLSKLPEYDASIQGLVKEFNNPLSNYEIFFTYKISDLGISDSDGFKTISVVGKVYNGDDEYDLHAENETDWSARLFLKAGEEKQFNAGVSDMNISFTSVDDKLEIHIKEKPVTKVIITEIKFNR